MNNCKTNNCLNLKLGLPERKETLSKAMVFGADTTSNIPILIGRSPFIEISGEESSVIATALFPQPLESASLKTLQISGLNESNLVNLKLTVVRNIGNVNETKTVDLEPFNTMDAFQTGKITINCADVKIYAEDALYISAENTSEAEGSTLLVTASFSYNI